MTGVPEPASPNIDMVDADVAERVLDQIITMAEDETNIRKAEESESHGVEIETKSELSPSQKSFLYPPPELIRTAHMAFNQACAFYQADRDDDCMRWADKAISVARLVPGSAGTKVVDSLQNRLNKMIGT